MIRDPAPRSRRAAALLALGVGALLLRAGAPPAEPAAGVTDPVTNERIGELLYGVTPSRLLDTRPSATVDGQHANVGFLFAGQEYRLPVRGRGAGQTPVLVPTAATGALLNVTVVDPTRRGYLTVWPDGARPNTSNVNFEAGVTTANLVFVALGADGAVRLALAEANAHVVVDVVAFSSDLPTI